MSDCVQVQVRRGGLKQASRTVNGPRRVAGVLLNARDRATWTRPMPTTCHIAIELVCVDQVWRKSHQAASFSGHRDLIVNSQAYRLYSIHATSVADAVKMSSESLRVVVPIFVSVRGD